MFVGFYLAWGTLNSAALCREWEPSQCPLGYGTPLFFLVGLLDDVRGRRRGLPAAAKLLLQAGAASVVVAMGLRFEGRGSGPFGAGSLGALAGPLTGLWVVAVVNVVNFTDGSDGIVAATCAVILSAASGGSSDWLETAFAAGAGAAIGFAAWNAPPAKIFMGDGGSHLLGFLVAAGACSSPHAHAVPWPLVAAPLVPFIVDVAEALVHKARHGIPMSLAHNDHLYQRLVKAGAAAGAVAIRYALLALVAIALAGPVATSFGLWAAILSGAAVMALHLWTGARATRGVPRLMAS